MANEFIARKGLIALADSQISGSLNLTGNITATGVISGEFESTTGTAISGAFTSTSGSIAEDIAENSSSIASLNAASSSYLLNTTDTLTGDLTVTGILTAQEFHTEFISASIIYESGSTQFGDSSDDTHLFTGSVKISENVDINGTELTIGTNDTRLAENNLRFKSSGDAYIDHNTTNQSIRIRTSNASALDTEAIIITGGGNFLMGNTVVNPASGFADQTGIGLKYSTTSPAIEVSSDSTGLSIGRTTTGGAGTIADFRYESNVRHSFGTANSYMLGNVGIDATSPGTKLDIGNTQGSGITMRYDTSTGYRALITPYWNSSADTRIDFAINRVAGTTPDVIMSVGYNGNVGIGTNTPSHPLHIGDGGGTEYIRVQGNIANSYFGSDSVGTFIGNTSDAPVYFYNSGSEKMRIDSSGNVGIGKDTQSGNATLTVKSPAGGNTGIILIEGDTTNDGHGIYATTNNAFVITRFTDGSYSDNFVMDSSGNVGIGSTSLFHSAKLSVAGKVFLPYNTNSDIGGAFYSYLDSNNGLYAGGLRFQTFYLNDAATGWTLRDRFQIDAVGNVEIITDRLASITGATGRSLMFRNKQTNGQSHIAGTINTVGTSNWGGDLVFKTKPANGTPDDNVTEIMRITGNGRVGIGTDDPSRAFHVRDAMTSPNSNFATNDNVLAIFQNTNVAANAWAAIKLQSDEGSGFWFSDENGTNYHGYISCRYTGDMDFHTGGDNTNYPTRKLRIRPTGGIVFNSDTADANTLDDYEEGDWTPSVNFGGGSTGITYSYLLGKYVKIGKLVYVRGGFEMTSKGSSSGAFQITGLPFTIESVTYADAIGASGFGNFTGLTGSGMNAIGVNGGTGVAIRQYNTSTESNVLNTNLTNSSFFYFNLTYTTT